VTPLTPTLSRSGESEAGGCVENIRHCNYGQEYLAPSRALSWRLGGGLEDGG